MLSGRSYPLATKGLAYRLQAPEQSRPHRAFVHPQLLRDFMRGHAPQKSQVHDVPVAVAETPNGIAHEFSKFSGLGARRGILRWIVELRPRIERGLRVMFLSMPRIPGLAAIEITHLVPSDFEEPRS